jgi:hypothetical protein
MYQISRNSSGNLAIFAAIPLTALRHHLIDMHYSNHNSDYANDDAKNGRCEGKFQIENAALFTSKSFLRLSSQPNGRQTGALAQEKVRHEGNPERSPRQIVQIPPSIAPHRLDRQPSRLLHRPQYTHSPQ